jgi:hypothetical protein
MGFAAVTSGQSFLTLTIETLSLGNRGLKGREEGVT